MSSNNVFGDFVAHDLDLLLKVKDTNQDRFSRIKVVISQTLTEQIYYYCQHMESRLLALTLAHSKGLSQGHTFLLWISHKRWQIEQILLLSTHVKSLIGFQMVCLHLTLAHSKGQSQGRASFDCEYLVNGDRKSNDYNCWQIASRLLAFDWYILHVTFIHSKCQGQGHLQFDCEKLAKTESCCISPYVSVYAVLSC